MIGVTFHEKIKKIQDDNIINIFSDSKIQSLVNFIFSHSPFLSRLIIEYPEFFAKIITEGSEDCFDELLNNLRNFKTDSANDLMRELRIAKSKSSLLIAVSDIAGIWELEKATSAMSEFAEIAIQLTINFLLNQANKKGEIRAKDPINPELESGIFVLAMGKLGAFELNYSSDIDLIIFFDKEQVNYIGSSNVQHYLSKMAQEMVRILQERTQSGYVFRVDLRLRPDPASTPAAMSIVGAITYYETVGQNWERAAFIKARPIAGDIPCGYYFLKQIAPFIWRKNLDFAAIADIQSIKRQMDDRGSKEINLAGQNIKTGIGGIREIEFYAQINQLIWGGRILALRTPATCKTLNTLAEDEMISKELSERLIKNYRLLRNVEHRLQMIEDQQTHTIPIDIVALNKLSQFLEYESLEDFENELKEVLNFVHDNFSKAFRGSYSLSSEEGKLSFTGVENNQQTLVTLQKMGYKNPASVSEII
ncbi:MAG: hypothetical protein WCJ33_09895, partial [Pseudomonadota bacterium]